jgi:hypothetical protein
MNLIGRIRKADLDGEVFLSEICYRLTDLCVASLESLQIPQQIVGFPHGLPAVVACGKTVHGVCTTSAGGAHFLLAQCASIGDNPALSNSGGERQAG